MVHPDSEIMVRVRRAQDKLVELYMNHPDVSLIDIGYPIKNGRIETEPAVRIHVREQWVRARPEDRVTFPKEVDDISVVVLFGDYQLE